MKTTRFKLGSDPELFLREAGGGALRSAIPIIEEGKIAPRKLLGSEYNGVLHDNVLIEFNTEPAEDVVTFVTNIKAVLCRIEEIVAEEGVELHLQASADFPLSELDSEESRVFGCDPDFDAYILEKNVIDPDAAESNFRSAGGHLHIGGHEEDEAICELLDEPLGKLRVVKAMDIFVGIVSVFLDRDPTAPARRGLYGKAGAHRPKTYGVEYRACSAWWLASPRHTELVHALCETALSQCKDGKVFEALMESVGGEDRLQELINDSLRNECREVYEAHLKPLLSEETQAMVEEIDIDGIDFRLSWGL